MPITRAMVAVLYEGKNPSQALDELMTRELKAEEV
jgi:glycerol-3-phosphate dehydrogenase